MVVNKIFYAKIKKVMEKTAHTRKLLFATLWMSLKYTLIAKLFLEKYKKLINRKTGNLIITVFKITPRIF